jgi:intracellular sulfur oxidation DsrE/DsrF family protein
MKEVIDMAEVKVIFHIDELDKWELLLKNVNNLLHAIDIEKSNIEVLANSEAVKFYNLNNDLNTDVTSMEGLSRKGIKFVACNNALNAYNIKKENLIDFIGIVPVGVLELINKQREGYAYIKP